eukprot:5609825-Alexandrium_andersonii.AAC.1
MCGASMPHRCRAPFCPPLVHGLGQIRLQNSSLSKLEKRPNFHMGRLRVAPPVRRATTESPTSADSENPGL